MNGIQFLSLILSHHLLSPFFVFNPKASLSLKIHMLPCLSEQINSICQEEEKLDPNQEANHQENLFFTEKSLRKFVCLPQINIPENIREERQYIL